MARNAEPNGMASIGKQMTVGGYAAVEQGGEAPLSPEDLGDITKETPRDSRRLTRRQIITRRFWRNKGAVVGAIGFLLMVLFALLGGTPPSSRPPAPITGSAPPRAAATSTRWSWRAPASP